jgi:hypothetical protein
LNCGAEINVQGISFKYLGWQRADIIEYQDRRRSNSVATTTSSIETNPAVGRPALVNLNPRSSWRGQRVQDPISRSFVDEKKGLSKALFS